MVAHINYKWREGYNKGEMQCPNKWPGVVCVQEAEQERHTLLGKLEQKSSMEAWYNEEIGYLKQQLAEGNDNLRETLETEKNMELGRLNRKVISL